MLTKSAYHTWCTCPIGGFSRSGTMAHITNDPHQTKAGPDTLAGQKDPPVEYFGWLSLFAHEFKAGYFLTACKGSSLHKIRSGYLFLRQVFLDTTSKRVQGVCNNCVPVETWLQEPYCSERNLNHLKISQTRLMSFYSSLYVLHWYKKSDLIEG